MHDIVHSLLVSILTPAAFYTCGDNRERLGIDMPGTLATLSSTASKFSVDLTIRGRSDLF